METMRIGLVGASTVATYAVIAAAREIEGVEVAAVAARDPAKAVAYAKQHGIPRVLRDYEMLFDDHEIDLVYIGTPPCSHAGQALAAIAAGKPVLVEKPFALSSAEAAHVERAGRAAGVPVFEAMHSPHHRLFDRVLDIVSSGKLGSLRRIEALFEAPIRKDDPIRWRAELGGGALMDLGVYPLAWVRRIAGEDYEVGEAVATMDGGVDAAFEAQLDFEDGLTARVSASMIAEKVSARLDIVGSQGTLKVVNPLAPHRGHALTLECGGETTSETVDGPSTYAAQLAAIRATILDGAPFPHPPGDFIRSMLAIERIRDAARRNEVVA